MSIAEAIVKLLDKALQLADRWIDTSDQRYKNNVDKKTRKQLQAARAYIIVNESDSNKKEKMLKVYRDEVFDL